MTFESLFPSLVASYEAGDKPVPFADEDFALDPAGNWIKLGHYWTCASSQKFLDASIRGTYGVKTWAGDIPPPWVLEAQSQHKAYCDELDAMPKYRLVTTRDQRIIRYAKQRAQELLTQQHKS